jgi:hypothetical protein
MDRQITLEAEFQFAAIRAQLRAASDLEAMRALALRAVDMMESQRQLVLDMLQQSYLPKLQKPKRPLP